MLSLSFSYPSHAIIPSEISHLNFALAPRQILAEGKGLQHSQVEDKRLRKVNLAPMVLPLRLLHCIDVWRAQAHETQGSLISNIIQKLVGMLWSAVLVHHTFHVMYEKLCLIPHSCNAN